VLLTDGYCWNERRAFIYRIALQQYTTRLDIRLTMNPIFAEIVESFESKLEALKASNGCAPLEVSKTAPKAGIYVLFDGDLPLYVGRSNRLQKRLSNHCRAKATHRMAAFAFRLAREQTGYIKATYTKAGSRKDLMNDPRFVRAFDDAKARIQSMRVRYVEESRPTHQALLEIYVAVALQTKYNDFDTH
jgi:predicted GIY-YIG superfamily endonuclease